MADIDWDYINTLNLDDSPEASARFDATLKRMLRKPTTPEEDRLLAEWVEKIDP